MIIGLIIVIIPSIRHCYAKFKYYNIYNNILNPYSHRLPGSKSIFQVNAVCFIIAKSSVLYYCLIARQ